MRLTMARLRRPVKGELPIQFVPQPLTSYGGLELLRRYVCRLDLTQRVRALLDGLGGDYGSHRLVLLVLGLVFTGARRLEQLRYVAGDPLLRRFCGLARLPTARTVANWLKRFTRREVAVLRQLNTTVVTEELARLELPRLTLRRSRVAEPPLGHRQESPDQWCC